MNIAEVILGAEEVPNEGKDESYDVVSGELFNAVEKKDKAAFTKSLKAFIEMCGASTEASDD